MKITITKNIDTEKPVDCIINNLKDACEHEALTLLFDEGFNNDEIIKANLQKVAGEIFENVITKLAFEYNKEG